QALGRDAQINRVGGQLDVGFAVHSMPLRTDGEADTGLRVVDGDVLDLLSRPGAGAGGGDPGAQLPGAAAQRGGVEAEEVAQLLALVALDALEHPLVERLVDPAGARAYRVVRHAARAVDREALGPLLENVGDRPAELPAA